MSRAHRKTNTMKTLTIMMLCAAAGATGYTAHYMQKSVLDVTPRDVRYTVTERAPTIVFK